MLVAYAVMCVPGSILQLFSPSLGPLVVGRFWNGKLNIIPRANADCSTAIGFSILTNIAPIYLSEQVPAELRARAVGLTIAGSYAAQVIGTVVVWGTAKISDKRQYIIPLAIQAAAPVLLLILTFFITESPIWLLSRNRVEEAKRTLTALRGGNAALAEAEVASAMVALQTNDERRAGVKPWEILRRENLERTLSSAALLCLSQIGGQILDSTYATVILVQSGVADPFKITVLIALLAFAGTLIGPFLVDKVGRRPVAIPGYLLLFLLDVGAGAFACAGLTTTGEQLGLVALCMIFAFLTQSPSSHCKCFPGFDGNLSFCS
jgi:MFS family permease